MWRPAVLQKAEKALLDEKASKLVGLARLMDQLLGHGFETWLTLGGATPDAPLEERVQALRQALSPMVDSVTEAFPAVGLGYCDAASGRIVAYGPSRSLGYLVGLEPPVDHLGWVAMQERTDKVAVGSMVRGDALNCMHPIIRRDQVIGFTFANESLEDIYRQINSASAGGYQGSEFAAVLGLSSLAIFAGTSGLTAERLQEGLNAAVQTGNLDEGQVRSLIHDLRQIERYVRLFLNNLNLGAILVGESGRVEYVNPPMQELGGLEPDAANGRPWEDVLLSLGFPAAEIRAMSATGDEPRFSGARLTPGNRSPVEVEVMTASLPGVGEGTQRRLLLFEDTQRARQSGEYFERAERLALAGELATNIAHEIRNPLTVVIGSVQLIPQRLDDRKYLLSFAEIAGRELARVNKIIQGLLGFARYSEPDMLMLDLGGLVTQAVEFTRWYAEKHGVEIVTHLPPRMTVQADAEHLQQAFLNILMNGIQAMPSGGVLSIRADHPSRSRFVRIRVEDQGVGIDPDALHRIWEVFYSSKPGGTGLGLPVVQRILDEHRGYVEVESVPGKGTCFTILLPLVTRARLTKEE